MIPTDLNMILASQSPRRKELLSLTGHSFSTLSTAIDETFRQDESIEENLKRIATEKAEAICRLYPEKTRNALVISADTTVLFDNVALGKPSDFQEALDMLTMLQGNTHNVITGFSLFYSGHRHRECVTTNVEFLPMSREDMTGYITTQSPYDKAGGYGIQDPLMSCFIKRIEGCYYNVVGLPLSAVYSAIRQLLTTANA